MLVPEEKGEEEVQEMTIISYLFEHIMVLIAQTFHFITYYRSQNMLLTMIDNL